MLARRLSSGQLCAGGTTTHYVNRTTTVTHYADGTTTVSHYADGTKAVTH